MPDTAEQCQITKVTIRIGGKEQTITFDQAKELKTALEELFGGVGGTYIPIPYTPYVPFDPWPVLPYYSYKLNWGDNSSTVCMSIGET